MTIQHSAITDAQRHEPKGASTASTGQIWTSDGAASGSFKNTITNCHGQMVITGNTTAKTLVAAADATLNTNTDYAKLTGASAPWADSYSDNVTFTTDHLTLISPGYYMVSFWASFTIASVNNFVGFKYALDSTLSTQKIVTQAATASDRRNVSATSIIGPVTANQALSLYVAGTIGTNITMTDCGLMVAYLHA